MRDEVAIEDAVHVQERETSWSDYKYHESEFL